jgi:photosystem II stability/assembly factor-like uncharacterized protein
MYEYFSLWMWEALAEMRKLSDVIAKLILCVLGLMVIGSSSSYSFAADWRLIGPEGGNVRSLAYDPSNPNHILLGTSAGQIFDSQDGGNSWQTLAHFGAGEDYVIDHIVYDPVNPATIYCAGWGLFHDTDGDAFRSDDGGLTWRALAGVHGKSIRALAMAPSDHNTLVIGALDGVFRSRDGGANWERMTPESPEVMKNYSSMKNFVSIAVDPQNPDIVYAGTRHLAWKTVDGGAHWHNISEGMLEDSDVFSIIVDPKQPSLVYASACSGIYKSDNGAEVFKRVQGIPHSAIRTRVLKQDPKHPLIVYAGTTGGLWKTIDGGAKWSLMTSAQLVVNDVLIDPRYPGRILLATDLQGVLASNDGFAHSVASNRGYSRRVVGAVVVDRANPNRLFVGLVNERELDGIFASDDAGKSWRSSGQGLAQRDTLSLQQAKDGTLFAGTDHGIFYLVSLGGSWQPASMIWGPGQSQPELPALPKPKSSRSANHGREVPPAEPVIPVATAPRVRSLQLGENIWYAATDAGLFISEDHGQKWYGQDVQGERDFSTVNNYDDGTLTLASHGGAYLSRDWGKTWSSVTHPNYVSGIFNLSVAPDSSLWLSTSQGAIHSTDQGQSWGYPVSGLPEKDVLDVRYDPDGQRLLATAIGQYGVFESRDGGKSWQKTTDAPVSIRWATVYQGHLLAASPYNGLLLEQPGQSAIEGSARISNPNSAQHTQ